MWTYICYEWCNSISHKKWYWEYLIGENLKDLFDRYNGINDLMESESIMSINDLSDNSDSSSDDIFEFPTMIKVFISAFNWYIYKLLI